MLRKILQDCQSMCWLCWWKCSMSRTILKRNWRLSTHSNTASDIIINLVAKSFSTSCEISPILSWSTTGKKKLYWWLQKLARLGRCCHFLHLSRGKLRLQLIMQARILAHSHIEFSFQYSPTSGIEMFLGNK